MGFPTGKKLCFLHPQAKLSRHRGAELCRRYGRLGTTSLFISVLTGVWLVNRLYHHPSEKSVRGRRVSIYLCSGDTYSDHKKWSSRYRVKEFIL